MKIIIEFDENKVRDVRLVKTAIFNYCALIFGFGNFKLKEEKNDRN